MSDQPQNETKQVSIHPQAALNEYAALKAFYENRTLQLAQALFDAAAENEILRAELLSIRAALEAELAGKEATADYIARKAEFEAESAAGFAEAERLAQKYLDEKKIV